MVFRFDDVRTFDIKLGAGLMIPYRIVRRRRRREEQKRIYRAWLGGL